jgi:hypothetical protein
MKCIKTLKINLGTLTYFVPNSRANYFILLKALSTIIPKINKK